METVQEVREEVRRTFEGGSRKGFRGIVRGGSWRGFGTVLNEGEWRFDKSLERGV